MIILPHWNLRPSGGIQNFNRLDSPRLTDYAGAMEKESFCHAASHHLRFRKPHLHLESVFGNDWFALKAEAFARFFGTPKFLIGQTVFVSVWIVLNMTGVVKFDIYPFILLNLAFSLQAAYAAPLILLAQTRQADRDKANAEADAQHREEIAQATRQRQDQVAELSAQLLELLRRNTELTEITKGMSERIESLTSELHRHVIESRGSGGR